MKDFRELLVWEKSHSLALEVYRVTRVYPKEETYGLTGQSRRAAVSVPANIAEGCGRGSNADFAKHLQISMGSACELEYLLLLACDLELLPRSTYSPLSERVVEVKRMLAALLLKVRADS